MEGRRARMEWRSRSAAKMKGTRLMMLLSSVAIWARELDLFLLFNVDTLLSKKNNCSASISITKTQTSTPNAYLIFVRLLSIQWRSTCMSYTRTPLLQTYSHTDQLPLPLCPKVNARLRARQPSRAHHLSALSSLLICTASLMWPMGYFSPENSKDDVWEMGRRKSRCSSRVVWIEGEHTKQPKQLGKWGGRWRGRNKGATQSVYDPFF